MGREVRRVPADWQHPKDETGQFIPLFDRSFRQELDEWSEENAKWSRDVQALAKELAGAVDI